MTKRAAYPTELGRIMHREGRRNDWLAKQVGAAPSQVSKWLWGEHIPTVENQEKIAQVLGRDPATLFSKERALAAARRTPRRVVA